MPQLALLLLIIVYLALASPRVVAALQRVCERRERRPWLVLALLVPFVLATLPVAAVDLGGFLRGIAAMLLYLGVPSMALLWRGSDRRPLDFFHVVAILALWLPVEFDWLPEASAAVAPGVALPVPMLTAVCLGLLLFLVIRPIGRVGYTYRLGLWDVLYALGALAAFAVIGLPLGIATGFITPGLAAFDPLDWPAKAIAIYFLTAVPEEFLFRGVINNLLEQRFGRSAGTWVAAAVIFGLSHINNVTAHHGPPNWPYVAMATFAGLAYGWVWRQRGKITAPAITHTLVNFVWGVVFRG